MSLDLTPIQNWQSSSSSACGVGGPQCVQNWSDHFNSTAYTNPYDGYPSRRNYTNSVETVIYQNGLYPLDGDIAYFADFVTTTPYSLQDFLNFMTGPNSNNLADAFKQTVYLNIPPIPQRFNFTTQIPAT